MRGTVLQLKIKKHKCTPDICALHKKSLSLEAGVSKARGASDSKAREAGDSIKPGAQAQDQITKGSRARETGDSVRLIGFRPLSRAPTSFIGT